jgi:hypothetical protein
MKAGILVLACCLVATQRASAKGDLERKTLAGLDGFDVVVENLDDGATAAGLDRDRLKTTVELKLRQTGIRVLTEEESIKSDRGAYLYVRPGVIAIESCNATRFAYDLEVRLVQSVAIDATPKTIHTRGATWHSGSIGYGGGKEAFMHAFADSLEECLNEFLNDYLAANPRGEK